jgi:hypothetical protein
MHIDILLMSLAVGIFALSEAVALLKRRFTTKGNIAHANLVFTDAVMSIASTILAICAFQNRFLGALFVLGTIALATTLAKKALGKSTEELLNEL